MQTSPIETPGTAPAAPPLWIYRRDISSELTDDEQQNEQQNEQLIITLLGRAAPTAFIIYS